MNAQTAWPQFPEWVRSVASGASWNPLARIGINERTSEAPQPIMDVLVQAPEVRICDEVVGCENE